MKVTRFRKITAGTTSAVLAVLAVSLMAVAIPASAAGHGPLRITFKKCLVADDGPFEGHYEGKVAGDLGEGDVTFTFESVLPGEVIWRFSGVYTVEAALGTFSAFAEGIDNLRSGSGHDVLNGEVIAGDHLGAQVQVRAHDTDGGACSEGTITITPRKERE